MSKETDNLAKFPVAFVALDARVSTFDRPLVYLNPARYAKGQLVLAPLGPRHILGVVTDVFESDGTDLEVSADKLRRLGPPIANAQLPEYSIELSAMVAEEYACELPAALTLFIPSAMRQRLASEWTLVKEPEELEQLTIAQKEVISLLKSKDGKLVLSDKQNSETLKKAFRSLQQQGLVSLAMRLLETTEKSSLPALLKLTDDTIAIENFYKKEAKKKPAQAVILLRMQQAESAELSPLEIKALCGVTEEKIKTLLRAGLLVAVEENTVGMGVVPQLNPDQSKAVDAIISSIEKNDGERFLLYGITGSGKTEVYLRAASAALRQGKQVLFLVPEIALTAQMIGRLRSRFGKQVAVLHSGITGPQRIKVWQEIQSGELPVVLGPRSALFAPFNNLGLIIVDEEHESSYKQEMTPRYHCKKIVEWLAKNKGVTAVFGSATPSIESFYEAELGSLKRLDLPVRAANAQLPEVSISNLTELYQKGKPRLLADELHEAIQQKLERKQQVVLFLNRRAYSSSLSCRDCGYVANCPNCTVTMSWHKGQNRLVCHQCSTEQTAIATCPECGSERLRSMGTGTEKAEELVRLEFPEARIERLDRDIAKKKGAVERIIAGMQSREIDVLIGTQMVAKGLDFPGVTLVGVILADIALHMPDFRASERAFQLLAQVGGRAGRGQDAGEVIIQTFSPLHPSIQSAQTHDYLNFYQKVLTERRVFGYPPFNRLVNILVTSDNNDDAANLAEACADALEKLDGIEIGGPVPCVFERLAGFWRHHLLIKIKTGGPTPSDLAGLLPKVLKKGASITVDADPYTLV